MMTDFHAKSIAKNSKGEVLLTALRRGFAAAAEAQQGDSAIQQKALIFTESRRTQEYLFRILEQAEFAGKVMVFNGTNTDSGSKEIFRRWLERYQGTDRISGSPAADMRAALVEHFRDSASIMIATEAAAEGINLQFCNLVVNYDLPWNPQRIEQRIGRCHRYGQKFDVVVVNFLNRKNAADWNKRRKALSCSPFAGGFHEQIPNFSPGRIPWTPEGYQDSYPAGADSRRAFSQCRVGEAVLGHRNDDRRTAAEAGLGRCCDPKAFQRTSQRPPRNQRLFGAEHRPNDRILSSVRRSASICAAGCGTNVDRRQQDFRQLFATTGGKIIFADKNATSCAKIAGS
jgi:superfamily II DNA/RNA helicase